MSESVIVWFAWRDRPVALQEMLTSVGAEVVHEEHLLGRLILGENRDSALFFYDVGAERDTYDPGLLPVEEALGEFPNLGLVIELSRRSPETSATAALNISILLLERYYGVLDNNRQGDLRKLYSYDELCDLREQGLPLVDDYGIDDHIDALNSFTENQQTREKEE